MKKVIILFTVLFSVCYAKAQEAVDLGLSVKWANMNLGASSPLEKGKKYAFGGTDSEPSTLTYEIETQVAKRSGYGDVDISGTKRDAARQAWGGKWRIPNREEVEELLDVCTREIAYIDGNRYFKFTGPNGKSILFPVLYYADNGNEYWSSSSAYKEPREAFRFGMSVYESTKKDFYIGRGYENRSTKLAIRPVMSFASNESSFYGDKKKAAWAEELDRLANSRSIADKRKAADMYYNGSKYVEKDFQKAFSIYKSLADNGDITSKQMIAKMYSQGLGTTKDGSKALELFVDPALDGDREAQAYLIKHSNLLERNQELMKRIAKAYVENSTDKSLEWILLRCKAAANSGNTKAMVEMAERKMNGKGVQKDINEAIVWYEKAARSGNLDAMHTLGKIYLDQTLGCKDLEKGIYWYTKAADGGHSQAKKELGTFYKYGLNVKKNKKLAKQYLGSDYDD